MEGSARCGRKSGLGGGLEMEGTARCGTKSGLGEGRRKWREALDVDG